MTPNLKFKKHCDQCICLPFISKEMDYSFLDNQAIFIVFIEMILGSLATLSREKIDNSFIAQKTSFRYIYQKEVFSHNTQYRIVPTTALKKII